jgi:hypothetical protein
MASVKSGGAASDPQRSWLEWWAAWRPVATQFQMVRISKPAIPVRSERTGTGGFLNWKVAVMMAKIERFIREGAVLL